MNGIPLTNGTSKNAVYTEGSPFLISVIQKESLLVNYA
jgi:hypothetical protein